MDNLTIVINMRDKAAKDAAEAAGRLVYIGRKRGQPLHFANPFTSKEGTLAAMIVPDPLASYRDWLAGRRYTDFMQAERGWVLRNLHRLHGRVLACWCKPGPCHGDVLLELLAEVSPQDGQEANSVNLNLNKSRRRIIRGLTLHQPWAYLIHTAGKRVENRNWKPPANLIGHYIAIHAGKTVDGSAWPFLHSRQILHPIPKDLPAGAVVAVAKLAGCVAMAHELPHDQRPWFVGPWGWVMEDVVPIEPVPCRGFQGLWELPADVLAGVRANWKAVIDERERAARSQLTLFDD